MSGGLTRDGAGHGRDVAARRVLLVEDRPVHQRVVTAMLEHLGSSVDVVGDGAQAVDAASRTSYDVILMDCDLPVLDGFQATGVIRGMQSGPRHTPIIAVTASATRDDRERCLAAGMDDYLTKPLSLKALGAILDMWAPERSAHAADPADPDGRITDRLEHLGRAIGEELTGELTGLFLSDAEALILALRTGLAEGDASAVSGSAHTLRGSSANLGATRLAYLCATLEGQAEVGDLVNGEAFIDEMQEELGRVRLALLAWSSTS